MISTFAGTETFFSAVKLNACLPRYLTDFGIVMLASALHPLKA